MVWRLQRVLPQVPSMDSESSWQDRWCLSPLPPGHLQHPSHPQSPQHCRWSHPPVTQFFSLLPSGRRLRSLQARTSRLKDSFIHQAVRKLNPPPPLAPPPLFYPTQHWTLTLRPPPQLPTSPGPSTHPPPPPYKLWPAPVTLCSTGLISTSSSIDCKLPLLTVW